MLGTYPQFVGTSIEYKAEYYGPNGELLTTYEGAASPRECQNHFIGQPYIKRKIFCRVLDKHDGAGWYETDH